MSFPLSLPFICFIYFHHLKNWYLGVERSSGLHFRQKVSQRVELFIKASLLLKQSLQEERRLMKYVRLKYVKLEPFSPGFKLIPVIPALESQNPAANFPSLSLVSYFPAYLNVFYVHNSVIILLKACPKMIPATLRITLMLSLHPAATCHAQNWSLSPRERSDRQSHL